MGEGLTTKKKMRKNDFFCCVPRAPCYPVDMKNEMEQVLAELAAITARFEAMVDDVEKTTEIFVIECRADRKKYAESMKKVLA